METRIKKWGNGLALRIPQPIAQRIALEPDSQVPRPRPSLDELLAGVIESNLHGEVDFGPTVGEETW